MLLFGLIISYFLATVFADPIISTPQGKLNGTVLKSRDGKSFFAFYGIPYAQPPVGKLRFAPPHKAPTWRGIRDATRKANICMQPESFVKVDTPIIGSEDCLYLSVFTPEINSSIHLPVMVYIHGGAFYVGSGDGKGPNFFMDKPMVVVTMNYRHGIFGFFSSSDMRIPGNYGLKDQVMALKWVKSNIENFGGDPNAVTILGQSSGSVCVHLHTMSPLSKGLFHRAVMQSGSALSFWSHYDGRHAKRTFNDFLQRMNSTRIQNNSSLLKSLREISAEELIRTEEAFRVEKRIVMKFRPVIERSGVKNAFLTTSPRNQDYQDTSIPWIMGFNSAEGIVDAVWFLTKTESQKMKMNKELNAVMPYFLHYKYFTKSGNVTKFTAALKRLYFKNGIANETDQQQLCNLISDIVFGMPSLHAAYKYPGPKYFYYYDLKSNTSATEIGKHYFNSNKTFNIVGASHGEEMNSLFYGERSKNKTLSAAQKQLALQLIAYWTNFIITGNPNSADLPTWSTLQPSTREYLHFTDDGIKMEKDLLHDRYEQWKKFNNL